MKQSAAKIGTILVAMLIVGMMGYAMLDRLPTTTRTADGPVADSPSGVDDANGRGGIAGDITLGNFGQPSVADSQSSLGDGEVVMPSLSVGVLGSTPMRRDVTRLESLPLTAAKIRRAYRDAVGRTCRVVIPGVPVVPPGSVTASSGGTYGRIPALTIGLSLDPAAASQLPAVVRAQVRGYLDKHRLSIQPTLYKDNMGQLYFGTDCQSAFYELDRPALTVKAETMIDTAIERLRSLGVVGSAGRDATAEFGRTLAMAFSFKRLDPEASTRTASATTVTEILLLHLPPTAAGQIAGGERPDLQIYITSDSRQTLNRIAANGRDLTSPMATIQSDVRFESTVLMGMYPADPVVSSIRYQAEGVLSMDVVSRMIQGRGANGDSDQTPMSVTEVLDRFGELSSRI